MGSIPWFECAEPHFRMLNLISSSIHHIHSFKFSILVYFYKCICIICILVCTYHANAIRIIRIYLHLPNGVFFCFFSKNCFLAETMFIFSNDVFPVKPALRSILGSYVFFFRKKHRFETATFPNQTATFPDPKAFFADMKFLTLIFIMMLIPITETTFLG